MVRWKQSWKTYNGIINNSMENQHTEISLKDYFDERWKAHAEVHVALKESIVLAREELNSRLEKLNELRAEVTKDRIEYARKDSIDSKIDSMTKAIDIRFESLEKKITSLELWKEGSQGSIKIILWLVGIGVTVVIGIAIATITQMK